MREAESPHVHVSYVCFQPMRPIKAMFGLINHDIARSHPLHVAAAQSHVPDSCCSLPQELYGEFFIATFGTQRFFFSFFFLPWDPNERAVDAPHTQRERTQATRTIIHSWDFRLLTLHQTISCIEYKDGREEGGILLPPTPIKVQSWEQSISDRMFWVGNLIFLKAST